LRTNATAARPILWLVRRRSVLAAAKRTCGDGKPQLCGRRVETSPRLRPVL